VHFSANKVVFVVETACFSLKRAVHNQPQTPAAAINVFQGASALTLDGKGRLNMPSRHRELLGAHAHGQLTITRHPHGCLLVFPRPEWELFRAKLDTVPMEAHALKRLFLGYAMDVELDGTGRVLVSPELRQAAGIARDVTLLGMGRHMELWDTATHREREEEALRKEIPDAFKGFSF
jgi:MraZ protein